MGTPTASVTLPTGLIVDLAVGQERTLPGGKVWMDADRLSIRNVGAPDSFNTSKWTPKPISVKEVSVRGVPRPHGSPFDGSRRDPATGDWILIAESDPHPVHPRYPQSATEHVLDGGDTAIWTWGDPAPLPSDAAVTQALATIAPQAWLLANLKMQRVGSMYTVRNSSSNPATPIRDIGWWMTPACYLYKYVSESFYNLTGWYHYGDLPNPGEGHSNLNYDSALWIALVYLLTGDVKALAAFRYLMIKKCGFGLIDTDTPRNPCWVKGWWRGEKGTRRGTLLWPVSNKEWDGGLCIASILWPEDPTFKRAMAVRRDCLLNRNPALVWDGGGGERAIGHGLDNLWWHWKATGDDAFKVAAQGVVNQVEHRLTLLGNPPYFPNVIAPGYPGTHNISGAEGATAEAALAKWAKVGVKFSDPNRLKTMMAWRIAHCGYLNTTTGEFWVAYQVSVPAGDNQQYNAARQGAFWSQFWLHAKELFPGVYDAEEVGWRLAVMKDIPALFTLDYGPWGGASKKWSDIICCMVPS